MSDYTPTTEQVRDGYRFNPEDDYHNPLQAGANAERAGRDFDRWLNKIRAEAWKEGLGAGMDLGMSIGETVMGIKPLPYPAVPDNPYRQEQNA